MRTVLIIISVVLILLVLLQSGKATDGTNIISGGNSDLFKERKERGGELFMTRMTIIFGTAFFILCLMMSFN